MAMNSAEIRQPTNAPNIGTSAVKPTITPPKNAYWIFKITPPTVTSDPRIRHSVHDPPM